MPIGSAFAKNSPGGNITARTGGVNMNFSMPGPAVNGSNLVGSLSYMGKTTLFSRVALSPNTVKGGDKKHNKEDNAAKGGIGSSNDLETSMSTQAGTMNGGNHQAAMGKTVRSSTTTSTFKETIQRGILSGAGILKK